MYRLLKNAAGQRPRTSDAQRQQTAPRRCLAAHAMGLPLNNPDGYKNSSAINFAEGLRGQLLIVHGSGDDNVHYSGTELLMNRLIELDKPFDFMEYPNRT